MISVTVYGGAAGDESSGEIGGNKILIEWDERAYFLDFGRRFSVSARFFEESSIRAEPGAYIVCISFWDITNLVDLEPQGGTYIYSSSEAFNEEQRIDHQRLQAWLDDFGLKAVGGLPGAEKGPYHASGHIDGPSMEWLIETIDPGMIVPVHSQQRDWFEQRWGERVVRAEYAVPVDLG